MRAIRPPPRVQIVRGDVLPWTLVDGVPQWEAAPDLADVLQGRACAHDADARQVALVGDSVLQVWQREPPSAAGTGAADPRSALRRHLALRLQARLDEAGRGRWCVRDVAQSGYLPYQEEVALRTTHADAPVDVAVIEVFKPDTRYHPLGPDLYGVDGWRRTARGTPAPWAIVPEALQDALFARSAAWSYATLALGGPDDASPELRRAAEGPYRSMLAWAASHGVDVVLLEVPLLDRPFAASAAEGPGRWAALEAEAGAAGAGVIRLAEHLVDRDHTKLRLDTCCHYAPEGHDAVAGVLAEALLARTPAAPPVATPPSPR